MFWRETGTKEEVVDEVAGVGLGAVDEARAAAAEEGEAHPVEAGRVDDHPPVVAHLALPVEDRHVQPRVVGPVARGPEHRVVALGDEVDRATRFRRLRSGGRTRWRRPTPCWPGSRRAGRATALLPARQVALPVPAASLQSITIHYSDWWVFSGFKLAFARHEVVFLLSSPAQDFKLRRQNLAIKQQLTPPEQTQ